MRAPQPAPARRGGDRGRRPQPALGPARASRPLTQLYLVRHGETPWTLTGQHTGRTDLELTSRGEEEARSLGRRLAGERFDAVFSSPLRRAQRTAELAGFVDHIVTDLLREFDYGDYEGVTSREIHSSRPRWELFRDGCPDGETPEQVYGRARLFVALARGSGEKVLAFGHGHILRAVAVAHIELDIQAAARFSLDVASLSMLADSGLGPELRLWNWTA